MTGAKLALSLALVAALGIGGWLLRSEIRKNGELSEQLAQQTAATRRAEQATAALQSEMELRDATIRSLQGTIAEFSARKDKIVQSVRVVYRDPAVKPWADAVPPPAVVVPAARALDCLWGATGTAGAPDCPGNSAARAAPGLPTPAGGPGQ